MKLRCILTLLSAMTMTGLWPGPALAQNRGDEVLLEMHQAFRKNDAKRLSALLPA